MAHITCNLVFLTSICYMLTFYLVEARFGILRIEARGHSKKFCIKYNQLFEELPTDISDALPMPLLNYSQSVLCEPQSLGNVTGSAVAVARGNCTYATKAVVVQDGGAKALLILTDVLGIPISNDSEDYNRINITVANLLKSDYRTILDMGESSPQIQLYDPDYPIVNVNIVVIWLMATLTVLVGTYWSAVGQPSQVMSALQIGVDDSGDDSGRAAKIQLLVIIFFVFIMCAVIFAIYFFYKYIVYAIIAIFTVYSAVGLYNISSALLNLLPFIASCRVPIKCSKYHTDVVSLLLVLPCVAVAVWWLIERNEPHIWVLQDFLGIVFCIHVLKILKLNSLMICTMLLCLLFVYDIFFVFISPYFMPGGKSIMIEVATKGMRVGGEKLPVVLRVPKLLVEPPLCGQLAYSLLGFGDIIVPGLLIAFLHSFDLKMKTKRIYYITSMLGYGGGLLVTFLAMFLMESGQPALLYLVPCTLLPTYAIALCRKEFRTIWRPMSMSRHNMLHAALPAPDHPTDEPATSAPPEGPTQPTPPPPATPQPPEEVTEDAQTPKAHENEHLIA